METIGKIIKSRPKQEKKQGGITSKRASIVYKILWMEGKAGMLKDELKSPDVAEKHKQRVSRRMKYWLGRTRNIPPDRLLQMIGEAKEGNNPMALLNWLIKQDKK